MKHKKTKLIKALNTIRYVCNENSCLKGCPLARETETEGSYCLVSASDPERWEIAELPQGQWKALL